ncbi:hypothetical protein MesoLjLc_74820 [Mesorhizobium sp. L-8-10]|uniref:DUF6931 family protein n=1 Tax=unclassified Mesorhizobium TaxID=325217 RepID=UPI001925E5DF|nr:MULTISPECIES: hypothetical protein [unclassified Mesorhizobium]BCH27595.1 hypothetical protein MesoLjLb_73800 [Mesorhizobium sp. L-8-3]BCH35552.1 hypothetical protein MesoLjLc_74820 [Mesorhizobium sp. L-8-10]
MKIQTDPFRKVSAGTAAEICARMDLSAEGRAFLLPTLSPQGYLSLLVEAEAIGDAIRFLAFALPIREGVWWAVAVAQGNLAAPSPVEAECLERAAGWVYQPDDARRRACMVSAETANFDGAAAYAALAAFWSGGSMAPPDMPEALPDPRLGAIGVGASILLSITSGDPLTLNERFRAAIARGIDIANGGNGRLEGDRPIKAG